MHRIKYIFFSLVIIFIMLITYIVTYFLVEPKVYDSMTKLFVVNKVDIDINGKKGPNTIAKDVFLFYVAANGIIPAGSSGEGVGVQKFESACGKNGVNTDTKMCTAWALYNNNMDYFKCNGLSWDGKHSCK